MFNSLDHGTLPPSLNGNGAERLRGVTLRKAESSEDPYTKTVLYMILNFMSISSRTCNVECHKYQQNVIRPKS